VFDLMRLAMTGTAVALPNLTSILPFLGLFSIVTLKPVEVMRCCISTQHLPTLSILQNNHFRPAPSGKLHDDRNVAWIFDYSAIADTAPEISMGYIPLSSEHAKFEQKRYWRLPLTIEAVLIGLMDRVGQSVYECAEINCAQDIYDVLSLLRRGNVLVGLSSGGRRGGTGRSSDGLGGSDPNDRRGVSKRKPEGSHSSEPYAKVRNRNSRAFGMDPDDDDYWGDG
jgi:hypothetical protein